MVKVFKSESAGDCKINMLSYILVIPSQFFNVTFNLLYLECHISQKPYLYCVWDSTAIVTVGME